MQFSELSVYLQTLIVTMKVDMNTNFLYSYSHIWPECISQEDAHENHDVVVVAGHNDVEDKEDEVEEDHKQEQDNKSNLSDADNDVEKGDKKQQHEDEEDDVGADPDHPANPLDSRDWSAWGRVNPQNTMVGKRKVTPVQRFVYDQRRRGGHYPDPKV
jgi:hypothetical protein